MADESDDPDREPAVRRAYGIRPEEDRSAPTDSSEESSPSAEPPPATNLDRALPPAERRRVRARRRAEQNPADAPARQSKPEAKAGHFTVLADRAGLHVFIEEHPPGQRTAILRAVHREAFPLGRESYFGRDSAPQGRFPNNPRQGGMSIDERLPMQREQERRLIRDISRAIASFLRRHPDATWDFAAGAPLHRALLDQLEPAIRTRLRRLVPKELTGRPVEELVTQFAAALPLWEDPPANRSPERPAP